MSGPRYWIGQKQFVFDRPRVRMVSTGLREVETISRMDVGASIDEALLQVSDPLVREAALHRDEKFEDALVTEPLFYKEFISVLVASDVVHTDFGGVQEEVPIFGRLVLVMLENTECPDSVDAGSVKHVGTDKILIVARSARLFG